MLHLVEARYRCTGCGDCCRGWDVPLVEGEAERFRAQLAPLVSVEKLTRALGRARHNGVEIETLTGSGHACAALADDNLCRIHAAHGGDAKPRACRIFPFTFVRAGSDVRVGLSFACPAVLDGEGPLLEEQRAEIEALHASAVAGSRYQLSLPDPVPLDGRHALPWVSAQVLLDEIARAIESPRPLVQRLVDAGSLCALTLVALDEGKPFADAIESAREGAASLAAEALSGEPRVDRLSRALFSTLLRATASEGSRLGGVISSLLGGGAIHLRGGTKVRVRDVERVARGLGSDGEALLARWLAVNARALTYFGEASFGLPVAAGLDLLALATAVAAYLARAHAAAAGRSSVTLDDAKAGLRQLDAGLRHRSGMPRGFARALESTAALDLLREQL